MPEILNENGLTPVPRGKIAMVVTYLQRPLPEKPLVSKPSDAVVDRIDKPQTDWFRQKMADIGERYLWFSRRCLSEFQLEAILNEPNRSLFAPQVNGQEIGLLELRLHDRRQIPGWENMDEKYRRSMNFPEKTKAYEVAEVAFFGLTPDYTGKGYGRWLMEQAFQIAASQEAQAIWLHTCTLDHPGALSFYQEMGFKAYRRMIEIADDPRLTGVLPGNAAPSVPII